MCVFSCGSTHSLNNLMKYLDVCERGLSNFGEYPPLKVDLPLSQRVGIIVFHSVVHEFIIKHDAFHVVDNLMI